MGADMLLSTIHFHEGANLDEIEKKMLELIPTFTDEELFKHYDEVEESHGFVAVPKEADSIRKYMAQIVTDTFESLYYRDVNDISFKGWVIYVTGGMSWGDDPTESFSIFDAFNNLPERLGNLQEIEPQISPEA